MTTIEKVVTEPDCPKLQTINFEQRTVFNIRNGFPLMNDIKNNSEYICIGDVTLDDAFSVYENMDVLDQGVAIILKHKGAYVVETYLSKYVR